MTFLLMMLISCVSMTNCGNKPAENNLSKSYKDATEKSILIEEDKPVLSEVNIINDKFESQAEVKEVIAKDDQQEAKVAATSKPKKSSAPNVKEKESLSNIASEPNNAKQENKTPELIDTSMNVDKDSELNSVDQNQTGEDISDKFSVNTIDDTTAENLTEQKETVLNEQTAFNHDQWDSILKANVSANGKVNYAGIKSNITKFDNYLQLLSDNTPTSSWSKNKTKAYWINAYNAFTIKLILDNYPVGSITDLYGGKPWDQKWIKLGGKTYSLNDIEHVILRPTYNDARIHFAVNCAAKSCPKVWNRAWTESNIEGALDKLTKEFVSNTSANQISEESVSISKIFEWYKEDFGNLIDFLNKYSATKISSNAKIAFNDYNWKLNS